MFGKPVRTYERKRGTAQRPQAGGSASAIVREDRSPDGKVARPRRIILDNDDNDDNDNNDDDDRASLEYDPFDTTFDRLIRDQIVHPIPPRPDDQGPISSYSDSSADETSDRDGTSKENSPPTNYSTKPKAEYKVGRDIADTKTMMKRLTRRTNRRGKNEPSTSMILKDENTEPDVEKPDDKRIGGKKRSVREEASAEQKRPLERVETMLNGEMKKRKHLEDDGTVKRCSVSLKRLNPSLDKRRTVKSQVATVNKINEFSEFERDLRAECSLLESPESPESPQSDETCAISKNPVVSLPSLQKPDNLDNLSKRPFSSSTPAATKDTRVRKMQKMKKMKRNKESKVQSSLALSPISSSDVNAELGTGDSLFVNSPAESYSMKSVHRDVAKILSITPDPEQSGLMFDETDIPNGKSFSPIIEDRSKITDPGLIIEGSRPSHEHRHAEDSTSNALISHVTKSIEYPSRASSSSTSSSDFLHIDNVENRREHSFAALAQLQKHISQKDNTSDEWSTIDESVSGTGETAALSGTGKIEASSCGHFEEEITSVRQIEIASVGKANEISENRCRPSSNENVLQPIVVLSRLSIGEISKSNYRLCDSSLESSTLQLSTAQHYSPSRSPSPSPSPSSPSRPETMTDVNEFKGQTEESEFFSDTEESHVEMESLMVEESNESDESLPTDIEKPNEPPGSPIRETSARDLSKSREEFSTEACSGLQRFVKESTKCSESIIAQQPIVLLTRLNDSVRITRRRGDKYRKWDFKLAAISENIDEKVAETQKVENVTEERTDSTGENWPFRQRSRDSRDTRDTLFTPIQHGQSTGGDKVVYLKPGKSWARSLSILSQVHSEEDLESLAVGKGRKWRRSVHNLLEMQHRGLVQSCVKKHDNGRKSSLFSGLSGLSGLSELQELQELQELPKGGGTAWISGGSDQSDTSRRFLGLSSPGRFIRRISIRVVPDSEATFHNIKDTSFLEAYGISPTGNEETIGERSALIIGAEKRPDSRWLSPTSLVGREKSRQVVLAQCGQDSSLPFEQCYPESYLAKCRKIGEGVYGEVFLYENNSEKSVIKIIPIEGDVKINSERQKKFDEILSEIVIAKGLHNLRFSEKSRTNCFVEVKKVKCVMGKYPKTLVELWKSFDEEKNSENDCPSIFEENQLYIILELGHGGQDLEACVFQNAGEAHALLIQTALALAVAEESLQFEHRDLHWGNLLISRTEESRIDFRLNGEPLSVPSKGVKVSVIDFTLSRMAYEGCSIFNDLSMDDDLFAAQGEYQFDIYRLMRNKLENNWQKFEPFTNILWLHYIIDKMITAVRYRRKNTKIHKNSIIQLRELKDVILDYGSAVDFVTNCDKVAQLPETSSSVNFRRKFHDDDYLSRRD